jgi:hypothetical protein
MTADLWPVLRLDAWRDTCETLHRWAQILGKVQLALTPTINHWWNVPLEITPRGFSTSTLARGDRWLDLELDFFEDVLRLRVSDGTTSTVPLAARTVAEHYADTMAMLQHAGVDAPISPRPAEVEDQTPFDRDTRHHAYDKPYVLAFWRIVARSAAILTKFRAGFVGKSSPVQFYWGHLDLSLSRFSGRRAQATSHDAIEREAYSHELFSVGWWAGDGRFEKPAFFAYAAPEPAGFATAAIPTPHAYYHAPLHGFYLDYDDVRRAPDPEALILDFCNATYEAAANLGGWDRAALERDLNGARG